MRSARDTWQTSVRSTMMTTFFGATGVAEQVLEFLVPHFFAEGYSYMPEATVTAEHPTPLNELTDDEILFRDDIRQFADEKVRPLSKKWMRRASLTRVWSSSSSSSA